MAVQPTIKKTKGKKTRNKAMFSKISYTLGPVQEFAVWPGVVEPDSKWAFPELGSIKMSMEEVQKDYGRFKKQAKDLQKWVLNNFSEDHIHKLLIDSINKAVQGEDNV